MLVVQTKKDAERFCFLGANPQRVKVVGNLKFDVPNLVVPEKLAEQLRIAKDQLIWVAGSTRKGEEEIVIEAWQEVRKTNPNLLLILAPRHLERLREVEKILVNYKVSFTRRSCIGEELLNFPVILLDTMGELASLYALAKVALVGGSLVPLGGHNPLEPAAQGVPVLVGPYTQNFSQIVSLLLDKGVARVVKNSAELAAAVQAILLSSEKESILSEQARQAVLSYQGAAEKTMDLVHKLLLIKSWAKEVKNWRAEALKESASMFSRKM